MIIRETQSGPEANKELNDYTWSLISDSTQVITSDSEPKNSNTAMNLFNMSWGLDIFRLLKV